MSVFGTCPICQTPIEAKLAIGRKSGKPSLSLTCPVDPRHFRGFINDKAFVESILSNHGESHGSNGEQAS